MAEAIFSKRSLENETINFEEFISVKGIKAIGNQLTKEKIKQINLLDSLPYEEPEVNNVEVVEEEEINGDTPEKTPSKSSKKENDSKDDDDDTQTTLF